ncbi:MAG: hypothetical protein WBP72_17755 [Rhodocyclaceae bacterium]
MSTPPALLVIGIHREERAFGEAVASSLDRKLVDVLVIPEGLSGRRPRPDQKFSHDVLHRALYLQLLPHMLGHHDLLIDLHTGVDRGGPCADLICSAPWKFASLAPQFAPDWLPGDPAEKIRFVALGQAGDGVKPTALADMAIPEEIWRNPRFNYVGVEVFLPERSSDTAEPLAFARDLITRLASGT